jgi:EmrB/QacA subfamily drug resistance transporter
MFFAGLLVFCAGSALCALAPGVLLLIAGRVVQGAGAAAVLPSSLGLLLAAFPIARRTQIVSLWGGVGALAVATGPTVGALLIAAGGWRWVFFVNIPIGATAWIVGRAVLRGGRAEHTPPAPDYLGAALVSVSLAALVLGVTQGPSWGWTAAPTLACFACSVLVGFTFLRRCAHHAEPVLDLTLFETRSFSVANASMVLYAMGFFAMLLGNILFLTSVWHYSILMAGLAVTPGPLVVACVSGPAGKIASKVGFRTVLLVGAAFFAGGLAFYATRVGVTPNYVGVWLPATLITGFGIGLTFPVLSATAVSSLHRDRYSVGSAVNQTARQVGGAVGVAILVVILGPAASGSAALGDFRHLWWYASGMAIASGAVCMLLRRPASVAAPQVETAVDPGRPPAGVR